jgi:hypothetical protein
MIIFLHEDANYLYHSTTGIGLIGITAPKQDKYTIKQNSSWTRNSRYKNIRGVWAPSVARFSIDKRKAASKGIQFEEYDDKVTRQMWGNESEERNLKPIRIDDSCVVSIDIHDAIKNWEKINSDLFDRDYQYRGFDKNWVRGDVYTAYRYFEQFVKKFYSKIKPSPAAKYIISGEWQNDIEITSEERLRRKYFELKKESIEYSRILAPFSASWISIVIDKLRTYYNDKNAKINWAVIGITINKDWAEYNDIDLFDIKKLKKNDPPYMFMEATVNGKKIQLNYDPFTERYQEEFETEFAGEEIYTIEPIHQLAVVIYGKWPDFERYYTRNPD